MRGVVVVLALFAVGPVAGAASPQQRLAFHRGNIDGPIYVMAADGSNQRIAPVAARYPIEYSPDGQRVLFVLPFSRRKSLQALYVAKSDWSYRRRVAVGFCFTASEWAPDSKRFAYTDDCEVDFESIWVANQDGKQRRRLTGRWNGGPVWSPDGRTILFTGFTKGHRWRLFTIDASGKNRHEIRGAYPEATDAVYGARWSRDGRKIFIQVDKSLYVMNRDGSKLQNLTPPGLAIGRYRLSPDQSLIAVHGTTRPGAARDIFVFAPGGPARQLTTTRGADQWPEWSPDGTKIAFESNRDGNSEIYTMNADGTRQTNLTQNAADDYLPVWIPARR